MKDKIEILQNEILIPDIVQQKANQAFEQIKAEDAKKKKASHRVPAKRIILTVLAATFLLGTVTTAAYLQRSRSLTGGLQITEAQQNMLSKRKMSKDILQSVTDNGITVTALQTITDEHIAYLSFLVEGYDCPENEQPDFEFLNITLEGIPEEESMLNYSASFYNGIISGPDGLIYDDGTPLEIDESGSLIDHYGDENGDLEFQITLYPSSDSFSLVGSKLHVCMENIGTVAKAMYFPDKTGKWEFDFTLAGSDQVLSYEPNVTLGSSGATVSSVSLSPISLEIIYDFPLQYEEEMVMTEDGQERLHRTIVDPPCFSGIRLKDGTTLLNLYGGAGVSGYAEDDTEHYTERFATTRVIDPNEVEALLFSNTGCSFSEDQIGETCYVVPLTSVSTKSQNSCATFDNFLSLHRTIT